MNLSQTSLALLGASVAYVFYLLLSTFLLSRRNAVRSQELKCESPPLQNNKWPFGLDHVKRSLDADRQKSFPVDMIQRTIDNSAITYQFKVLGTLGVFTADEKNIQAILATQFADFDLGPTRRGNFFPLLGNGIFTEDGKAWEHSRAMIRPQFSRELVSDLDLEELHVRNMMNALDATLDNSRWTSEVDLQVLFFRLTLDSATEFLFGKSVDSQITLMPGHKTSSTAIKTDFATAFDKSQQCLATRARLGEKYWLFNPKEFKDSCKVCHDFIDEFVDMALSKGQGDKGQPKKTISGKDKYVFLEALAAQTQDPLQLRSQLLNILLAGRDTTASHLGWLFYSLARDPQRFRKLRDVVLEDFGTYENPKEITFAKLKSCQYLQYCNNEILRLYPVVPVNGRYANKDTTLPRGGGIDGKSKIFIPKGTACEYSVHVLHHRKDIWGPDAENFRPERWQNRKVGWEFLPFNGGPRICVGQQFALTEASYVIVRLLQRFDKMENVDSDPIARHNLTLTNCSANGVKVRLHSTT